MYIPKRTLCVLALLSAALLGWMLRVDTGDDAARPAPGHELPTRLGPAPAATPTTAPAPTTVPPRPQVYVRVVGGGTAAGLGSPVASSSPVEPQKAEPGDAATNDQAPAPPSSVPPAADPVPSVESVAATLPIDLRALEEQIFRPLPGAESRAVTFSQWESARSDVAGTNVLLTTDDSNLAVDRDGRINANTGDTDGGGLNVTDATESHIRGSDAAAD